MTLRFPSRRAVTSNRDSLQARAPGRYARERLVPCTLLLVTTLSACGNRSELDLRRSPAPESGGAGSDERSVGGRLSTGGFPASGGAVGGAFSTGGSFGGGALGGSSAGGDQPIFLETGYLKGAAPEAYDRLGFSVALEGDTLAIGATGVDKTEPADDARAEGAVYVFRRQNGSFQPQAVLHASNHEPGDSFGWRVALSGDTLVVGAYGEDAGTPGSSADPADNSADNAGAAYVFERRDDAWAETAYLKAFAPQANDWFGRRVAVDGDLIAISAYGENGGESGEAVDSLDASRPDSGAVYLFERQGSGWEPVSYLKAPIPDSGDQFGSSLALSQDFLAVGAFGEASALEDLTDNSAPNAGAVYLYPRRGRVLGAPQFIKSPHPASRDHFGGSLDLTKRFLAVGAFGDDGVVPAREGRRLRDAGAVFVFDLSDGVASLSATLKASNADERDWFGTSVSLDGERLLVGAFGEDARGGDRPDPGNNALTNAGAAYLFAFDGRRWLEVSYLKAHNAGRRDRFGWAVALAGSTAAVGAFGEGSGAEGGGDPSDDSAVSAGAVYVFEEAAAP